MAANKVIYGGETLVDLTMDSVTPDKLAAGVTAHDKSGNKITGTMSANFKIYDITLAHVGGWVLLTALDSEVLAHINDSSLVVTLTNMSPYEYVQFTVSCYIAMNIPFAYVSGYGVYGLTNRQNSTTSNSVFPSYMPANNTKISDATLMGNANFRITDGKYYFRPDEYGVRPGNYRLTFCW